MTNKRSSPEHNLVRKPFIEELIQVGWNSAQIQFSPEWTVPKNPSSASKREAGESYDGFPVDIAIFDKPENLGNYQHLSIIVETKAPDIEEGRSQLETYLSREPHVKLGIWTNGKARLFLFRAADGLLFPGIRLGYQSRLIAYWRLQLIRCAIQISKTQKYLS